MSWIEPKTNWTEEDYYNFDDLNRVESNTEYLVDLVETYSTRPNIGDTKTDWGITDFPFADDIGRAETNIDLIRQQTYTPLDWTPAKLDWSTLDGFGYEEANRLERNLVALYVMINLIKESLLYCGTFSCGQGNTEL